MSKDVTVSISDDLKVDSVQVIINQVKGSDNLSLSPLSSQIGTFIRQVFPAAPGANVPARVRITCIPDDRSQNISIDEKDENPGEKAEWTKMLGDPPGFDLDAGITTVHFGEDGGRATWLPNDENDDPVSNKFNQKTPAEPNGASIGDFMACWIEKGRNAAAFANCISKL